MGWHVLKDGRRVFYAENPEKKTARMRRRLRKAEEFNHKGHQKWSTEEIREFLRINDESSDLELCRIMERGLGSIMYMRRKLVLLKKYGVAPDTENLKLSEETLKSRFSPKG